MEKSEDNIRLNAAGHLELEPSLAEIKIRQLEHLMEPLSLEELLNYKNRDTDDEYKILKQITNTEEHKKMLYQEEYSKVHNRYPKVLPIASTRVKLSGEPAESLSTYINANYIMNPYTGKQKEFIATQGPIEVSVENFWRMAWEEGTTTIVMLCGFQEYGRMACHVYWPDSEIENGTEETPSFKIALTKLHKDNEFFWIRDIQVTKKETGETRKFTQYHSVGWPDMRTPAPKNYCHFLTLIEKTILSKSEADKPVIVHCSAGIGRTGTFLSLFFILSLIKSQQSANRSIQASIFGTVRSLREQRSGSVETAEQYLFINKFVSMILNDDVK